jgi:hypothetical protein
MEVPWQGSERRGSCLTKVRRSTKVDSVCSPYSIQGFACVSQHPTSPCVQVCNFYLPLMRNLKRQSREIPNSSVTEGSKSSSPLHGYHPSLKTIVHFHSHGFVYSYTRSEADSEVSEVPFTVCTCIQSLFRYFLFVSQRSTHFLRKHQTHPSTQCQASVLLTQKNLTLTQRNSRWRKKMTSPTGK